MTYLVQRAQRQIVEWHPNRSSPVVLALSEEGVVLGKGADAVRGPELGGVVDEVEDGSKIRRVGREEAKEHGEEGDVAGVADGDGLLCEGRKGYRGNVGKAKGKEIQRRKLSIQRNNGLEKEERRGFKGKETYHPHRQSRRSTSRPPRSSGELR
jgi:hypothetical protein